jgi:hypothetical protein
MAVNLNTKPYYDDYNIKTSDGLTPKEKYHQILFRPGHAVQARELTQIQSILQNQVTSLSKHFFKEGSLVLPGHCVISTNVDYIKINSDASSLEVSEDLIGVQLIATSGDEASSELKAKVVAISKAKYPTETDTIYLEYISSDTPTTGGGESITRFREGQFLRDIKGAIDGVTGTMVVSTQNDVSNNDRDIPVIGKGSIGFLDDGIYFLKGYMVIVKRDYVILDKYSQTPTADIGLLIDESISTSTDDVSLNDNALGTYNYAAPGAHRYQIKTKLHKQSSKVTKTTSTSDFVLLSRVVRGEVVKETRSADYSVLGEALAKQSFNESGSYSIRPFTMSTSKHIPNYDLETGLVNPYDETKFTATLSGGSASIKGHHIEKSAPSHITLNRSRDKEGVLVKDKIHSEHFEGHQSRLELGNFITVNMTGTGSKGFPDTSGEHKLYLYADKNNTNDAHRLGSVRVRYVEKVNAEMARFYIYDVDWDGFGEVTCIKGNGFVGFFDDETGSPSPKMTKSNTLLYTLPHEAIYDHKSGDQFDFDYNVSEYILSNSVSENTATFTTSYAFQDNSEDSVYLLNSTTDDLLTVTSLITEGVDTIKVKTGGTLSSSHKFYLYAKVNKASKTGQTLEPRKKSLRQTLSSSPETITISTADKSKKTIILGKPDIIAINSIIEKDTGTDITAHFRLDDGQRDNFYTNSRIIKKSPFDFVGTLEISYTYYEWSGNGDFFTADSYPDSEFGNREYNGIRLSNCIDFRPYHPHNKDIQNTQRCPTPHTLFTTSFSYYLPRTDKIVLDVQGNFTVVEGIPSLEAPSAPTPADTMHLYDIYIPAYTHNASDVRAKYINNRRYTMKDIGTLDKRINKLERNATLSLLELETNSRDIKDRNGFDKFKLGFLADGFSDLLMANLTTPEFKMGIDKRRQEIRPKFVQKNVNLQWDPSAYSGNTSNIAQKNVGSSLVTLPYSIVEFKDQHLASSAINVNPYDVFNWEGSLELSPSSDEWKDTDRMPDLIVGNDGIYDAMMGIIDATDILGTEYQSWTVKSSTQSSKWIKTVNTLGHARGGGGKASDRYTLATTTTGVKERYGIETFVEDYTYEDDFGDRVVDIRFAPYMRSRPISFKVSGLKPNTRVYANFDGIDVSTYCRQEHRYQDYSDTMAEIEKCAIENWGVDRYSTGRNFYSEVSKANSFTGDIFNSNGLKYDFTHWTESAKQWKDVEGVNMHPQLPTPLITDAKGSLVGSFFVPNTNPALGKAAERWLYKDGDGVWGNITKDMDYDEFPDSFTTEALDFKGGSRLFRVSDNPNHNRDIETTTAESLYQSTGIIQTVQGTIYSTKLPMVTTNVVSEEKNFTTTVKTKSYVKWWDPLAQSFLIDPVECPYGLSITSIDVYFKSKPNEVYMADDDSILSDIIGAPVTMQLREMQNGIPSNIILPGSTVTIAASEVHVSPNQQVTSLKTPFDFAAPVYLQAGVEYCFVLLANSTDYNVWAAEMNKTDIETGVTINKQPYLGVLFKSQNSSTWTADQNTDLKFTINRAKFDNDVNKVAIFTPPSAIGKWKSKYKLDTGDHGITTNPWFSADTGSQIVQLKTNALTFTKNSSVVRVQHKNHGFISGGSENAGNPSVVAFAMNERHGSTGNLDEVEYHGVKLSKFSNTGEIDMSTTGKTLGDILSFEVSNIEEDSYDITLKNGVKATSSGRAGLAGSRVLQYVDYSLFSIFAQHLNFVGTDIKWSARLMYGNTTRQYNDTVPFLGLSDKREIKIGQDTALNKSASIRWHSQDFILEAEMSSLNDMISPIIDTDRLSILCVQNKINSPVEKSGEYPLDGTNEMNLFFEEDSIVPDENDVGSVECKHVTKNIQLEEPANSLNIYLDIHQPVGAKVEIFYKVGVDIDAISDKAWSHLAPALPAWHGIHDKVENTDVVSTNDPEEFVEYEYFIDSDTTNFDGTVNDNILGDFSVYAVKIVFTSTNKAKVPRCKNLRAIATYGLTD